MHLMQTNIKVTAIVITIFVYSCYASDGSVVKSIVDNTVGRTSNTHHQSNRPPEKNGGGGSGNGWHTSDSSSNQQKPSSSSSSNSNNAGHASEKTKSSYAMLSQAMSEAVHHEFSSKYLMFYYVRLVFELYFT